MSPLKIFVSGATGAQGGGVVRAALSKGWLINAIVRDTTSAASGKLKAQGANLFPGDWDDLTALETAMAGCTAAFVNVLPSFTDAGAEQRHAQNIFNVAKKCGVRHVIYSSVAGIDHYGTLFNPDPESFMGNYWRSKSANEKTLTTSGWETWTLLRGAVFMNTFLLPGAGFTYPELASEGKMVTALLPESKQMLVNPEDIGSFAVAAFADPQRFHGKKIEIGAEAFTTQEIASCIEKVSGKTVGVHFRTDEEIEAQKAHPLIASELMMRNPIWSGVEGVEAWGLPLTSFEEYLTQNKDLVLKSVGPA
ncbi:hypothetical protein BP6252_06774 [Coleophoma cylindrospora]|uniref:NmrA-like domain-containing protein n=1 Tax=Coleophoma cylindrospora TaxID=1849047 RepID=A0A3D8RFP8_9HELO|nr:hypothetical protein BP6252_06774 [Coleophoma cylindrospora]